MKLIHTVGDVSLECDILETENPPELMDSDPESLFINQYSCEYFLIRKKYIKN